MPLYHPTRTPAIRVSAVSQRSTSKSIFVEKYKRRVVTRRRDKLYMFICRHWLGVGEKYLQGYEIGFCCSPRADAKKNVLEALVRNNGVLETTLANYEIYSVDRMQFTQPDKWKTLTYWWPCVHLPASYILIRKGV